VGVVAISAYGWVLTRDDLFGTDVLVFVTLEAHYVDLVALKADVRRRSANVFIVCVSGAETVTADASDFCPEVSLAQLLFDERHVAHVAGRIGAEGIGLVELRRNIVVGKGGSGGRRTTGA
jgi:hypothetical protein